MHKLWDEISFVHRTSIHPSSILHPTFIKPLLQLDMDGGWMEDGSSMSVGFAKQLTPLTISNYSVILQ